MADNGNGKYKNLFQGAIWTLIIGSYAWTLWLGNSLAKEIITNDKNKQADISKLKEEDNKLRECITDYIMPMREDIASIKTILKISKESANYLR